MRAAQTRRGLVRSRPGVRSTPDAIRRPSAVIAEHHKREQGCGAMCSGEEVFRETMRARDLDGGPHTVIVIRRGLGSKARVWLTLNGAWKTTIQMTDPEAAQLAELLSKAQRKV